MALGNVNAAPVRLNALLVENVRLSLPSLQGRIILHYSNQFTAQLYRILGSADMFGNPVGLFNNVSSGVHDIFYEPYQGFVLHGNKELASGIARVSRRSSSSVLRSLLGADLRCLSSACRERRASSRRRSLESATVSRRSLGRSERVSVRTATVVLLQSLTFAFYTRYIRRYSRSRVPGSSKDGSASEQAPARSVSHLFWSKSLLARR